MSPAASVMASSMLMSARPETSASARGWLPGDVEGEEVPVLELALDVGGGEGDGALAQADGVQVGVGEGEAEFFAGFAGAVGDGFAGVVVAADGDVGVVGSVERIAAWGFLLQDDAQVFLGGLDGQAIVAQDDEVGRDDEVTGPRMSWRPSGAPWSATVMRTACAWQVISAAKRPSRLAVCVTALAASSVATTRSSALTGGTGSAERTWS